MFFLVLKISPKKPYTPIYQLLTFQIPYFLTFTKSKMNTCVKVLLK